MVFVAKTTEDRDNPRMLVPPPHHQKPCYTAFDLSSTVNTATLQKEMAGTLATVVQASVAAEHPKRSFNA
jgi:hypothetical protein